MKTKMKATLHTHMRKQDKHTRESKTKAEKTQRESAEGGGETVDTRKERNTNWNDEAGRPHERAKRGLGRGHGGWGFSARVGPIAVQYPAPMTSRNTLNPIFRV